MRVNKGDSLIPQGAVLSWYIITPGQPPPPPRQESEGAALYRATPGTHPSPSIMHVHVYSHIKCPRQTMYSIDQRGGDNQGQRVTRR